MSIYAYLGGHVFHLVVHSAEPEVDDLKLRVSRGLYRHICIYICMYVCMYT
jgi:hypothetical protein